MSEPVLVTCPACASINRIPKAKLGDRPKCGRCKAPLFQGQPVEVDETAFNRHVSRDSLPVVADFWANWCGPCHAMAPAFKSAAAELEPHVRLLKVDTEAEPRLAGRFAIRSIPTLIAFRNGNEIARVAGAMDRTRLLEWVRRVLAD
jgi:thioredoxin 2